LKTAILLGSTGLVGSELLKILIADPDFEKILLFSRRTAGFYSDKVTEYLIDFDKPELWSKKVKGDVVFSAFGTTIKKAGGKVNQFKIDYTYQYSFANAAAKNGVPFLVLVSSMGASENSSNFYLSMKGKLDADIEVLPFSKTAIIRPGILDGKRKEKRILEKAGIEIGKLITMLPGLKKYKPIPAEVVALSMVNIFKTGFVEKAKIFESSHLFKIAGK